MIELGRIEYLGLDRVIKRGSAEIIEERDDALFLRDGISGAYFLACEDERLAADILERHADRRYDLLMTSNHAVGAAAFKKFGFFEKLECFQVAYYGKKPAPGGELTVRTARRSDLPTLAENYRLISPGELEKVVERESMLLGFFRGQLVGFVGEHLEGSMGLLYVFPEFRRRGFASQLQSHMIARTMDAGYVPFGQVEKDNAASLKLQEKLGMTRSGSLIVWMWREEKQ